jgi:GNAT superfamily N-acetyltransferase
VNEWTLREATSGDAMAIAIRRVEFLREQGHAFDEVHLRESVREYLMRAIPTGDVRAWVAETDDEIIATGVMTIYERMMWQGVGREGYVLSMYTVPEWRKKGIGTAIVDAMIAFAREDNIKLALIATDDGRPIYERAGFTPDPRYLRWR